MIIQYYADSLGLTRPGIVALNDRYIYIFELWLRKVVTENVIIINRAKGGATIDTLYETYEEDNSYLTDETERDILIIHEGICDCAPRPISKRLKVFISKLPQFLRSRIVSYLHKNRAKLLRAGSVYYMVESKQYEECLFKWLTKAVKNFKRIYIFNIAPPNAEIESHSPGFSKSVELYNSIIKDVIKNINNPIIRLIDMHALIKELPNIDEVIVKEDGHHITAFGHKIYAEQLIAWEAKGLG